MNLVIQSVISSSIFEDYSLIRRITLGSLIGEGGFGSVYKASKVDGVPNTELVVKILHDGDDGDRGYETAMKLQEKLNSLNKRKLLQNGGSLRDESALYGSPQFCFEGKIQGQVVKGYAMLDLTKLGYVSFDTITDSKDLYLRSEYNSLGIGAKLRIALSLVSGFKILAELYYVHADVNPQNLFINLKTKRAAIIDFDSGAIMDGIGEEPTTLGRIMEGEWLAPEILEQIASKINSKRKIRISLLTDYWAVALAIHYLLFLRGPYFFLKALGKQAVLAYLLKYKWYDAGPNHSSIDASKLPLHTNYVEFVSQMPAALVERFRKTFNEGFAYPAVRTTSSQWVTTLSTILDSKPTIVSFGSSVPETIEGHPVKLKWKIKDEFETFLDGQDVSGTNEMEITLEDSAEITLEARGIGGVYERRKVYIEVHKYPRIFDFRAETTDIGEGQTVKLHWDARYHQQLWLNGEVLSRTVSSMIVHPWVPLSEYVLSSKNEIGEAVSQVIAVHVHKPPILHRFWTDRSALTSQDPLTIFWDADLADEIEIRFKQLVGYQYSESSECVLAASKAFVTYVDSACEITCIAKSKYGESRLGPLRVDVVAMPRLEFLMQRIRPLPVASICVEAIELERCEITFLQVKMSNQNRPTLPSGFQEFLRRNSKKSASMFVISICLAVVSGVIGYFLALHR